MATSATPTQPQAPPQIAPRPSSSPDATTPDRIRPSLIGDRLHRLSVEQYHRMAQGGVLTKEDRVELIEGLLVEKMTKNERHLTTTWLFHQALGLVLPPGWFAVVESPVVLARSEPEPDVMVVRGRIQDYFGGKPRPAHVALVVEVSDTSYAEDHARGILFAEAGIPRYWIANLHGQRVETYADPTGPNPSPDYQSRRDHGPGDVVPLVIEGREIARLAVDDLLAPRVP